MFFNGTLPFPIRWVSVQVNITSLDRPHTISPNRREEGQFITQLATHNQLSRRRPGDQPAADRDRPTRKTGTDWHTDLLQTMTDRPPAGRLRGAPMFQGFDFSFQGSSASATTRGATRKTGGGCATRASSRHLQRTAPVCQQEAAPCKGSIPSHGAGFFLRVGSK